MNCPIPISEYREGRTNTLYTIVPCEVKAVLIGLVTNVRSTKRPLEIRFTEAGRMTASDALRPLAHWPT